MMLDHLHQKLREDEKVREHLQLPKNCVIHSLRHTFLARFGDAANAFTIKWSRVKAAFERFANLNQEAAEKEENDKESRQYLLQSESGRL